MSQKDDLVVALDLGNSMTRAIIAEAPASGACPEPVLSEAEGRSRGDGDAARLRFLGFGEVESQGWHKGSIADIGQAAASVRKAVEQAEAGAGVVVSSAVAGIGGPHLQGLSSRAGLLLSTRPREVRRGDVQRVIQDARNLLLAKDREILHLVPKEFVLDSQEGIRDPVGMRGSRLEVRVHAITSTAAVAQNLVTAVNRAGILVETLLSEAFAAGEVVPSSEERELGVLVTVLGGASCEMVAYGRGGLCMAGMLPVGGDHFTSDIAIGLRTSRSDAESIKRTFGSVFPGWSHDGTSFEVPGMGHQPSRLVPQRVLRGILEARAKELFTLLREELRRGGLEEELAAGVILSGGAARLPGLCDLAEKILGLPARIGLPPQIPNLPENLDFPEYAPLLGLLLYAQRLRRQRGLRSSFRHNRWKELLIGKR